MSLPQLWALLGAVVLAGVGAAFWARARAESRLRQPYPDLDRFFTTTLDLLCVADVEGRFRRLNPQWEAVLGYPAGTLEGTSFLDLVHPEDREATSHAVARLRDQQPVLGFENRYRCHDGSYRWLEWRSSPQGELIYAAARDITQRKHAERSLAREQMFTKAVLDSVPGLLYVYDDRARLVRWNRQHETMTGYSGEELAGMTLFDWYRGYPEEAERIAAAIARIPVEGHAEEEALLVTKSGQRIPFYLTAVGLRVDERDYFVGIGIDVTQRRRAEAELRENEARLRLALAGTNQGLYDLDLRTGHAVVSPEYLSMLGYDAHEIDVDTAWWQSQIHPDDVTTAAGLMQECVRGERKEFRAEYRLLHKSGDWRWMLSIGRVVESDARGRGLRMLGTRTDITERKQAESERRHLEERLAQAQKMESIGRLAGGVAHDFNNMIQSILGNASMALEELPPGCAARQSIEEIQESALRSAELTRQLLGFARKQAIEPRVLDLNDTVSGALKMLGRLIGEGVQLSWLPAADLWPTKMDSTQVDQVLANLCVNARDAMSGSGRLTIGTANVSIDEAFARSFPDGAAGDYVMLAVTDTGRGMDVATQAHLFEPFFTTKAVGHGTGLGLATVFGIVKQNSGLIRVDSEPGRGTTLSLYFPRTLGVAVSSTVTTAPAALQGTETVLLVEDELQVLRLGRRVLRKHGYRVLTASAPDEAQAVACAHDGPIHLLLLDVVMPGMNGKQLWAELLVSRPGLRCLFMSGYTSDVIAHEGVLDAGLNFIQKPFSLDALAAKVRETLDAT
jgi:PAS domain S-box-containing protein